MQRTKHIAKCIICFRINAMFVRDQPKTENALSVYSSSSECLSAIRRLNRQMVWCTLTSSLKCIVEHCNNVPINLCGFQVTDCALHHHGPTMQMMHFTPQHGIRKKVKKKLADKLVKTFQTNIKLVSASKCAILL